MNLQSPYLITDMTQEVFHCDEEVVLESGDTLPQFQLSFTTQGHLTPQKDNVIWILHALTGDANVHEWWSGLVGEDKRPHQILSVLTCWDHVMAPPNL